jgi:hypothetical protein
MNHQPLQPWYVALLIANPASRSKVPTAIADAMFTAIERAFFNPRSAIHRQTVGYYDRERQLTADEQVRAARIAANSFAPP